MAHSFFRGIAQLVEQRSPKPRAEGSKPSAPAKQNLANTPFARFLLTVSGALQVSAPENKQLHLTLNACYDILQLC